MQENIKIEDTFDEDTYYFPEDDNKVITIILSYKDNFITKNIELTDDLLPDDLQERLQDSIDTLIRD